jgi:hypothetical protein
MPTHLTDNMQAFLTGGLVTAMQQFVAESCRQPASVNLVHDDEGNYKPLVEVLLASGSRYRIRVEKINGSEPIDPADAKDLKEVLLSIQETVIAKSHVE